MNSETESAQYDEKKCYRIEDEKEMQFSTFKDRSTRRVDSLSSAHIIEDEESLQKVPEL